MTSNAPTSTNINDASVEYFDVSDFDLLDDEEEFNKLCEDLNFDPLTGKIASHGSFDVQDQSKSVEVKQSQPPSMIQQQYSVAETTTSMNNEGQYHQVTPEYFPQSTNCPDVNNCDIPYSYPTQTTTINNTRDTVDVNNYGQYFEYSPPSSSMHYNNMSLPPYPATSIKHQMNYQQQPQFPHHQQYSTYDDDDNEGDRRKKSKRPVSQPAPISTTVHCIPMMSNDFRNEPPAPPAHESHVLPPTDIRRSYGSIFIDAINQVEGATSLDEVLDTYCTKGVCTVYKFMGKKSPHNSNYIEVHGRDAVGKYWHGIFAAYPDYFYELLSTKIKVLLNGFSCVTSQFAFTATKVLNMVSDTGNTVIVSDPSKPDDVNGGMTLLAFKVDGENRQVIEDAPPTENILLTGVCKPLKVNLLGTITYYVNSDKLVYKIEVLYAFRNAEDDA